MSQMSYRKSFILLTIGQFFVPFMTFISIVLLFQRFSNIQGWSLYEVALCYGIVNLAYSTSECFARGFDMFSNMIRTGSFDRIMLRPRGTILQVFGSKFEFTRLGRFIQSLAVLIFALVKLDLDYTPLKILTLILMVSCGVIIFTGIYIIGATLCFFTIDGVEIMNIFTDGGREMAKYPLGIYKKSVQKIFTFIIPFGVVNYYPLMFVLGKSNNLIYAFMPLYGIIFFIPCIWLWSFGVKHYKSTGS
jgi:ABC-2 type transport system permease protein